MIKKHKWAVIIIVALLSIAYGASKEQKMNSVPPADDGYSDLTISSEPSIGDGNDDVTTSSKPSTNEGNGGQTNTTLIASGKCGKAITWKLDKTGKLTLSGSGAIPDYEKGSSDQPWAKYRGSITMLVIEDGISRIGDRAFQGCKYIESAHIGGSVSSIGEWAFQNCYALTSVQLPSGINLETGAFRSAPVEWDAGASSPTAYSGSSYHSALRKVSLTGNYRDDIINIALSQVGYHEGNSEADYAGNNQKGSKDYTEYGRRLDSVGAAWCSEFASWCIRMAGVPTDIIASSRGANVANFTKNTSARWYTWRETSYQTGSYAPRKGDILLWLWNDGSFTTEDSLSHTSILWEANVQTDGSVVLKTIDGNSNNQVRICTYKVNAKDGSLIGKDGKLCYIVAPDYEAK